MGNLYGLSGYGLNSGSLPLPSGPRAGAYEQSVAWELGGHQDPWSGAGYGASGNDLTGYEGLPNMDGGGVNHRYPYHSYRRPWAHPGPPSTNVSIVW